MEALQNEQCSPCPVAVNNNGWGNGHWGIQTVHCWLRPQTPPPPQSVSLPLSHQGQCIYLKQEMLPWMTAYNKHFMLLWVPWQCYLILWKPISTSLPSHTWAHNGISSSYILWAWYHRYRKGRRLKFRLKKKDKEEKIKTYRGLAQQKILLNGLRIRVLTLQGSDPENLDLGDLSKGLRPLLFAERSIIPLWRHLKCRWKGAPTTQKAQVKIQK